MAIRGWHPGKIAVVWAVTLASRSCLPFLGDPSLGLTRSESGFVWFLFVAVAAAITWRWLGGREGRSR